MVYDLVSLLKKRNQELLVILETSRILTSKLDLEELLTEIMHQATKIVGAESSSLMLLDEVTNELVFDIAMGKKGDNIKHMRMKVGEGIAGWVAEKGLPLVVDDVTRDERFNTHIDDITKYKTKSILCVPLKIKDRVIGVMEAINKEKCARFDEADLSVFSDFAAQSAVAIDNAKLFGNLAEEKGKIEAMFSGMGDGAVFTDSNFRIIMINEAAAKLMNADRKKVVGTSFRDFEADYNFEGINKIKYEDSKSVLFDITRKKGKKLFVSCKVTSIVNEENITRGYVMVLRDVTNDKKELMMTRDFFSLISHKLKTPLVSITGYTPMLLNEKEFGGLNEFQRGAVKAIDEQGKKLQNLIDKLLSFTSLGINKLSLMKEPVGLKELVDLGLRDLQELIKSKKAVIEVGEFVSSNPQVFVDKNKISGVIRSIVENGIKFNDKEEKIIKISAARGKGSYLAVTIMDNGPGIPSEEYDNIFKKFYQVEEYFTGQVDGAGLGLAFARDIIEGHDGRIEVSSTLGEGSTFKFILPVKKK